ncbi:MAG: DUF433 domain-containing protein [bacterium]
MYALVSPCIRGTRIRVSLILDFLASGMSIEEIVAEYPQLTERGYWGGNSLLERAVKKNINNEHKTKNINQGGHTHV